MNTKKNKLLGSYGKSIEYLQAGTIYERDHSDLKMTMNSHESRSIFVNRHCSPKLAVMT